MKPHKYADVLIAIANGKEVQWRRDDSDYWIDESQMTINPLFNVELNWRIKPEAPKLKLIDWSKMPRGTMTNFGEVREIDGGDLIIITRNDCLSIPFKNNPHLRLDGQLSFQYWGGGKCPVPEGVVVEIEYTDGGKCKSYIAHFEDWNMHKKEDSAIRAYRIIGLKEGFTDH